MCSSDLKLKRDQANKGGTVFADYNRGVWRHHLYLKVKALREEQPSPGLTRGLSRGNEQERVAAEIGCSQSTLEGIFKEEQAKDNAASAGKGSGVFIDRRGPREI